MQGTVEVGRKKGPGAVANLMFGMKLEKSRSLADGQVGNVRGRGAAWNKKKMDFELK